MLRWPTGIQAHTLKLTTGKIQDFAGRDFLGYQHIGSLPNLGGGTSIPIR
jgi:hypothetical protein